MGEGLSSGMSNGAHVSSHGQMDRGGASCSSIFLRFREVFGVYSGYGWLMESLAWKGDIHMAGTPFGSYIAKGLINGVLYNLNSLQLLIAPCLLIKMAVS